MTSGLGIVYLDMLVDQVKTKVIWINCTGGEDDNILLSHLI